MKREAWVRGGREVALGGERVWYRVDGSGPTILFAHGYPTSSHDWAGLVEALAPRYRCVCFDFLGFGASSKPRRAYTYALQHEVLARVVEAAAVTRAVLVAHDYAVTIGQELLARTPPPPFALDGIVFMNGGVDPAHHRARPVQRFLASPLGRLLGPHVMRRGPALRALRAVLARKDALDEDAAWEAISSDGGLAVMPLLLDYMAERRERRAALVAALGATTVPLAFLWGLADPVSGAHMLDAIRGHAPGALVRALPGVGHYPQLEAPAEAARFLDATIAAWLAPAAGVDGPQIRR
jgi:pimeloyl-ACP methyl ester carboxylesterase